MASSSTLRTLVALLALAPILLPGPAVGSPDAWPDPDDAPIRPGVQIFTEGAGWCTTNFVFTDRVTGRLFLGTAAHCVPSAPGADVHMPAALDYAGSRLGDDERGPVIGTVAYTARQWEDVRNVPCFEVLTCAEGTGNADNDFALIEIAPAWRDRVHPSVRHFGGPTGLAPLADVDSFDKVISYGNSALRAQVEPTSWKEGYVAWPDGNGWTVYVYTASPGIPGDSGSNILLGDGRALGIVVTLGLFPPGINGVTALEPALAYARAKTGWDLQLETWPLATGGVIPS